MVVAQAQAIEIADNQVVFTFTPVHRSLRNQLDGKRKLIEEIASDVTGRRMSLVVREIAAPSDPAGKDKDDDAGARRQADLKARAKAEPSVQAVLDVFGGEIEDVEEIE